MLEYFLKNNKNFNSILPTVISLLSLNFKAWKKTFLWNHIQLLFKLKMMTKELEDLRVSNMITYIINLLGLN